MSRVDDWRALVDLPAGWELVEVIGDAGAAIPVDDHEATEVVVDTSEVDDRTGALRMYACPDCGLVARGVRRFDYSPCERDADPESRCGVSLRGPAERDRDGHAGAVAEQLSVDDAREDLARYRTRGDEA